MDKFPALNPFGRPPSGAAALLTYLQRKSAIDLEAVTQAIDDLGVGTLTAAPASLTTPNIAPPAPPRNPPAPMSSTQVPVMWTSTPVAAPAVTITEAAGAPPAGTVPLVSDAAAATPSPQ